MERTLVQISNISQYLEDSGTDFRILANVLYYIHFMYKYGYCADYRQPSSTQFVWFPPLEFRRTVGPKVPGNSKSRVGPYFIG